MEQGQEVGALARECHPDGIFVAAGNGKTPAERTRELIEDVSTKTLFEAAFVATPFVAKADILIRQSETWHLLEVKSAFSSKSKIKERVNDIAYTAMVLQRAGFSVGRASLALLSRDFRYGDNPQRLFEIVDVTEEAVSRASEFHAAADSVAQALFADVPPPP